MTLAEGQHQAFYRTVRRITYRIKTNKNQNGGCPLRRQLLCSVAAVAIIMASSGPVTAADMPLKARPSPAVAPFSWAGFYMGVHVGYAWDAPEVHTTLDTLGVGGGGASQAATAQSPSTDDNGLFGGFQLGYNVQTGPWVYGLETDLSVTRLRAAASPLTNLIDPGGGLAFINTATSGTASVDWFGTVRGRVGFAWDRALLYGTAGLAYGDVHVSNSAAFNGRFAGGGAGDPFSLANLSDASKVRLGWAAGAGVDYAVTPNMIFSIAYLHVDLGDISATNTFRFERPGPSDARAQTTTVTRADVAFDTVSARLSWKFSPI